MQSGLLAASELAVSSGYSSRQYSTMLYKALTEEGILPGLPAPWYHGATAYLI